MPASRSNPADGSADPSAKLDGFSGVSAQGVTAPPRGGTALLALALLAVLIARRHRSGGPPGTTGPGWRGW